MGGHVAKRRRVLEELRGGMMLGPTPSAARPTLSIPTERPKVSITPAYVRSLALSDRDLQITRFIGEMAYVTIDQVARLWFGHTRKPTIRARNVLRRLWELHVLDRTPGDGLALYGLKRQTVYMLGRAGETMMAEEFDKRPRRSVTGFLLNHNTLLSEAAVRLTLSLRAADSRDLLIYGERLIGFDWENQSVRLRPDALFVVRAREGDVEFPFFVELDTGTRDLGSFRVKQLQYRLYLRSRAWQTHYNQFPGILVICCARTRSEQAREAATQRRVAQIIARLQEGREGAQLQWFFTTLEEIGSGCWKALVGRGELRDADLFRDRAGADGA